MKLRDLLGLGNKKTGVVVQREDGKEVALLNPHGKGEKYATELKTNHRMTSDGRLKTSESGEVLTLSNEQRAYRSGYLDARTDSAKAYKAKNKVGK